MNREGSRQSPAMCGERERTGGRVKERGREEEGREKSGLDSESGENNKTGQTYYDRR